MQIQINNLNKKLKEAKSLNQITLKELQKAEEERDILNKSLQSISFQYTEQF